MYGDCYEVLWLDMVGLFGWIFSFWLYRFILSEVWGCVDSYEFFCFGVFYVFFWVLGVVFVGKDFGCFYGNC